MDKGAWKSSLVTGSDVKMQVKPQDCTTHFLEWFKWKWQTTPNAKEDVEQLEFSDIAEGRTKLYNYFKNCWEVS